MIDPRRRAVLIHDAKTGQFQDMTSRVSRYEIQSTGETIVVVFNDGGTFPYGRARVRIIGDLTQVVLDGPARVEVRGDIWPGVTEVWRFAAPEGTRCRVFYRKQGQETYRTYPDSEVRVVPSCSQVPVAADVFHYWCAAAACLPTDDSLRGAYRDLKFIHPESVLGRYLTAGPIERHEPTTAPIFPFRSNLSQRQAVENALTHAISVIEGPPGTGKTETILNLIANIISVPGRTVAVVSFTNAAVDNVRDKLAELGFGYTIASLGRAEKRAAFLAGQESRNAQLDRVTASVAHPSAPERLAELYAQLRMFQQIERDRAGWRAEVAAYRLERQHFERHLQPDELPDLAGLPLLQGSADRILDYLAESELARIGARRGLVHRIRNYFRYGSMRGLDPDNTAVVLGLQRAYYDRRIAELEQQITQADAELARAHFDQLAEEHRQLSADVLRAELGSRYKSLPRRIYERKTYRRGTEFSAFVADYPVLSSTGHSLRNSIATDYLLDYVIIDEASQVNLLVAGLALSCCRNLVVVGDQRQLSPIELATADLVSPAPAYDLQRHNLLSSLAELHGADLPRTLLREHYRCDPMIIGFCNKKFYNGELVPYTTSGSEQPMIVVRSVEGNHMRQHRGGGRSNQREVDVIADEVIPRHCAGIAKTDIGVTTPYRLQADKATDAVDRIEADTVHKFQGRQKQVVILTTVLDETWRGRTGLRFVDDPQLINVAVSRAMKRFILVTNNDMVPTSRHLRDLVGYIGYQNPGAEPVTSAVVSIFDLLYSAYSERLRPLAERLTKRTKYRSEAIAWTVLDEILAEDRYAHLTFSPQVLVQSLLPDLGRLTPRQTNFVQHRASVDFVVYNRVTNHPLLAIEVDGFAFHENNPAQLERDAIKSEILQNHQLPLLRLPTTGSREYQHIRRALDRAEAAAATRAAFTG